MLDPDDYARLSAAEIADHVRGGRLAAGDVAEAAIARMQRHDPALHAFCTPTPEVARAAAREVDARIAAGAPVGLLAGVPVAIKDLVLTRGIRTTFGSRLYADFVPAEDDVAVARLRGAGALILGKTNVSEFGYGAVGHNPLFPTTRNPWNLALTPGGSSAGSAAAVAAGICPIAVGSDGGGSIRLPASFTGIVGVKASMGRVPLWPGCRDPDLPGASGWELIEHIGPLARSVADAALMLHVMAGPDPRDRLSLPAGDIDWLAAPARPLPRLALAWCPRWADLPIDPEVAAVVGAAVQRIGAAIDASVTEIASPFGDEIEGFRALVALETDLDGLRRLAAGRMQELAEPVRRLLETTWTARDFSGALVRRKRAVAAMADCMARYDALLTPTAPCAAFPIDQFGPGEIAGRPVAQDAWSPFSYPANLSGQPAASIPVGWTRTGLPVGLQVTGRHLEDASLLALTGAIERLRLADAGGATNLPLD